MGVIRIYSTGEVRLGYKPIKASAQEVLAWAKREGKVIIRTGGVLYKTTVIYL